MGLGTSPFGTSPLGSGSPTTSDALVGIGYHTSPTGVVSSVQIDPLTHDIVVDDFGNEVPMSDAGQRVYCLCMTLAGSRIDFPDGFSPPKAAGADEFQRTVEDIYRTALAPATIDGTIRIDEITTEVNGTRGYAQVKWTDLTTSKQTTTKAPLGF